MDSTRQLQQRALHQIFQSQAGFQTGANLRPLRFKSLIRPQQCLRNQQRRSLASSSTLKSTSTSSSIYRPSLPGPRRRILPFTKPGRRFFSNTTGGGSATSSPSPENLSLSQRMRKLSREYGYAALGVYLTLTALDLPFCYLAVSYLGTERIGRWEHAILSYIKGLLKWPIGEESGVAVEQAAGSVRQKVPLEDTEGQSRQKRLLEEEDTYVLEDHGYGEAEKADRGDQAGFWTKLALAYAIHKSFIFIRVPITAAITPKVVKTLRGWGWNIGKMPSKKVVSGTGVNTGTTGVKPKK